MVVVIPNLPFDRDRRVQRQAAALAGAGYRVSVVCPRAPDRPRRGADIDAAPVARTGDADVHGYPAPPAGRGAIGFALEFAWVLAWTAARLLGLLVRDRPAVVQLCNPPDIFFPLALVLRLLRVRVVFDHHDLAPEVYRSKFGRDDGVLLKLLLACERATFASADHVLSTNASYREIALTRGRRPPEQVTVVRNGPAAGEVGAADEDAALREGAEHLLVYVGIMGAQDGVDLALRAFAHLVHGLGRRDCRLALLGEGDALPGLRRLAAQLHVADRVTFVGWAEPPQLARYLATADVGLQPDPSSPLNDRSTMAKTVEYLAAGVPVVAFDLLETQRTAGEAAVYLPSGDVQGMAAAVAGLLDDPQRRARMSATGRARIADGLGWEHQARAYVGVVDRLTGRRERQPG